MRAAVILAAEAFAFVLFTAGVCSVVAALHFAF